MHFQDDVNLKEAIRQGVRRREKLAGSGVQQAESARTDITHLLENIKLATCRSTPTDHNNLVLPGTGNDVQHRYSTRSIPAFTFTNPSVRWITVSFEYSEGGFFKAKMTFPMDYPLMPPELKFVTTMYHPNGKESAQFHGKEYPVAIYTLIFLTRFLFIFLRSL
jgi:hypothetical protein